MTPPTALSDFFELITPLTESERHSLHGLAVHPRSYTKKTAIFNEGEPATELSLVEGGICFTNRHLEDGSHQIIDIHFPGEIIGLGEFSKSRHHSGLVAMTDTRLLHYNRMDVIHLVSQSPRLMRLLLDMISRGYALLNDRMIGMARYGAKQRVANLLLEVFWRSAGYPPGRLRASWSSEHDGASSLRVHIPQNVIADTLGLSVVHVSRILSVLKVDGLIGSSGRAIILLDVSGLGEVAGWESHKPRGRGLLA